MVTLCCVTMVSIWVDRLLHKCLEDYFSALGIIPVKLLKIGNKTNSRGKHDCCLIKLRWPKKETLRCLIMRLLPW